MTARLNPTAGERGPDIVRLVAKPVFVLSTVRSGSTLLRCLLNSHSQLYAPSELHLRHLRVHLEGRFAPLGMDALGITARQLEHILWDRLLAHLLARSGKAHFVDKTPSNAKIWDRLIECWPDARFIVLRRNPAAIVASIMSTGHEMSRAITVVSEAVQELEHAATSLEGRHLLTYEDLTASPEECLRGVCAFLGIEYEAAMLHYGRHPHGPSYTASGTGLRRSNPDGFSLLESRMNPKTPTCVSCADYGAISHRRQVRTFRVSARRTGRRTFSPRHDVRHGL